MQPPFAERSPDAWSAERKFLLERKIAGMQLRIEGTYLEGLVQRLYQELESAGMSLRPRVYLSDEWSCPDRVPLIGVPFYLVDPKLTKLEDEMMEGVEAETEEEILAYLRHEAGHAFNYAYKLYESEAWTSLFGSFDAAYLEDYVPRPFSRNYVRHIPGWYAQKHPDEDFAETFAVWLTPRANWRELYAGWGCLKKLEYVDELVKQIGRTPPPVTGEDYDIHADIPAWSVQEHYERTLPKVDPIKIDLDDELRELFRARGKRGGNVVPYAAHELLRQHRRSVLRHVAHWTGLYEAWIKALLEHCIARAQALDLQADRNHSEDAIAGFTAFVTTLCMNKLYEGDFVAP
ncbi:MAG TPA: putative zinc-binding metallopeptidase [Polyangiales bacterium]|jgi:hypothetical protein|nr:putative zinc-binding metallopeptidase [Polyangiales bacterium]